MEANVICDESVSFYAVLNVPRDASDDDVKKSFRQLAQAYHPDKHTDPALKAHAAAQFTQIQEAYEVLLRPITAANKLIIIENGYILHSLLRPLTWSTSTCLQNVSRQMMLALGLLFPILTPSALQVLGNAAKRQVYDIYGKEGLAAGLQVVPSGKSTEELKKDWEGFRTQQVS